MSATLYQHDRAAAFRFEVVGEFRGALVEELSGAWRTAQPTIGSRDLLVDVQGITDWDDAGVRLLRELSMEGATIYATAQPGVRLIETVTGMPVGPKKERATGNSWRRILHTLGLSGAFPCRDEA